MTTVANFAAGTSGDTVDIALNAFSGLLRSAGGGGATPGTALFSNLVAPAGQSRSPMPMSF